MHSVSLCVLFCYFRNCRRRRHGCRSPSCIKDKGRLDHACIHFAVSRDLSVTLFSSSVLPVSAKAPNFYRTSSSSSYSSFLPFVARSKIPSFVSSQSLPLAFIPGPLTLRITRKAPLSLAEQGTPSRPRTPLSPIPMNSPSFTKQSRSFAWMNPFA